MGIISSYVIAQGIKVSVNNTGKKFWPDVLQIAVKHIVQSVCASIGTDTKSCVLPQSLEDIEIRNWLVQYEKIWYDGAGWKVVLAQKKSRAEFHLVRIIRKEKKKYCGLFESPGGEKYDEFKHLGLGLNNGNAKDSFGSSASSLPFCTLWTSAPR